MGCLGSIQNIVARAEDLNRKVVAVFFNPQAGNDMYDYAIVLCCTTHNENEPEYVCWEWTIDCEFSGGLYGSYSLAYGNYQKRIARF